MHQMTAVQLFDDFFLTWEMDTAVNLFVYVHAFPHVEWVECRMRQWEDINWQSCKVRKCTGRTGDESLITSKMLIALAN